MAGGVLASDNHGFGSAVSSGIDPIAHLSIVTPSPLVLETTLDVLGTIVGLVSTYTVLVIAAAIVAFLGSVPVSDRADRIVTRVGLLLFGAHVHDIGRNRKQRNLALRSAHFPETYRVYASKTLVFAIGSALAGGLVGIYLIGGMLHLLALDPATLREMLPPALHFIADFAGIEALGPTELVPLFVVSSLSVGAILGLVVYWLRWWYPKSVAVNRSRQIDATLPGLVAFIYALSRSGMAFPQVMRQVANHTRIYGAAAEEVEVGVRHMDLFGQDMITAIQTMGRQTPSDKFEDFAENLASVLQSGRNLESFLEAQYEEFREETESQQQQFLNLLSALAETYVTAFVAGPLFLITVLVVIGIAGQDVLQPLQLIVYLVLPLANLGFIVYLDMVTSRMGEAREIKEQPDVQTTLSDIRRQPADRSETTAFSQQPATDGGILGRGRSSTGNDTAPRREAPADISGAVIDNIERLRTYEYLRELKDTLGNPIGTVRHDPITILYVTFPLAVFGTLYRMAQLEAVTIETVDGLIIQAAIFLVGTFAVAYEVHNRRLEAIEAAVPDFLDRLASVNEAGMSVVESIERVRGSDLGALTPEVDRLWADIQWGADVDTALQRFEYRVQTQTVSRVVALITNAMSASGQIARVLRIAANQAKADRTLKRERRQEMLTYVIVVYMAFLVFLVIIAALDSVLLPALPEAGEMPEAEGPVAPGGGMMGGMGDIPVDRFQIVFQHTAMIQALCTGFIAGQMQKGDVRAGAKHATIMLIIAYVVFLAL